MMFQSFFVTLIALSERLLASLAWAGQPLALIKPATPSPPANGTAPVIKPFDWNQWWFDLTHESIEWVRFNMERILIAVAIGLVLVAALYGVRWLGGEMSRVDKKRHPWMRILGQALGTMRPWFILIVSAQLIVVFADAPVTLERTINALFVIATALQGAIFIRDLTLGAVAYRANDHEALNNASGIISLLVTTTVFVIAFILMLSNLGINVTSLVAGLGIGGIAIGLAAQGIFSDLFSALSILFDKPFKLGENIQWGTMSGTVERIGLKTTRLRATSGEEVIVSNTNLLNKELLNTSRMTRRRVNQLFGVVYQTPPELCEDIPRLLRSIVEGENECIVVRCGMSAFNSSSLDFELHYDVLTHDYEVFFAKRAKINIAILKAFNERGIDFAYPTQMSFTAAPDGRAIMPYPEEEHVRMLSGPMPEKAAEKTEGTNPPHKAEPPAPTTKKGDKPTQSPA